MRPQCSTAPVFDLGERGEDAQPAELTLLPGEGHFLVFERWREILAWLLH